MCLPKLRFPKFYGEWLRRAINEITDYVDYRGRTPQKASSGIPLITAKNIKQGYIDYEASKEYILLDDYELVMRRGKPILGDIVITTEAPLGNVAMIDFENVALAQRVIKLRSKSGLNNSFLKYRLIAPIFQKELNQKATGTTAKGIKGSELHKIVISFPALEEQERIASFLSEVDKKVSLLNRKKELLEQYKKGVMQQLFSKELCFKQEDGSDFPDWEEKNGNELFENISNKKHDSDLPILAITQEFGAIPRDLIDFNISVSDQSVGSYKVVEVGDFIISLRSFQGGIEYSNYRGICSPAYVVLRPAEGISRQFYKHYFKTEVYIQSLNKNLEGIRDGKMISYKYFSEIRLPLPSLKEQQRIADFLDTIDEKIAAVRKQITQTETWKKGLLQQLFC